MAKRIRSESGFRLALGLPNCHTLVKEHLSFRCIFQRYCSTNVRIFVVSFSFTVQKWRNKMPVQNFCMIVKLFPT